MASDNELRQLIDTARDRGAILRTKVDASDCIVGVSFGRVTHRTMEGWLRNLEYARTAIAAEKGDA